MVLRRTLESKFGGCEGSCSHFVVVLVVLVTSDVYSEGDVVPRHLSLGRTPQPP